MKQGKSQYRLQTLYDLKVREEDQSKEEFAVATRQAAEEKKKLDDLNDQLAQMRSKREERVHLFHANLGQGISVTHDVQGDALFIKRLEKEEEEFLEKIEEQEAILRDAQVKAEMAKQELIEISRDVKTLEKHKDKWLADLKKKRAGREEKILDEIGTTRFIGKK